VTVFYCAQCWRKLPPGTTICPVCGADVERLSNERSYVQKLIVALDHPEPQTPVRAAWLLGQLRAFEAVPALIRVAQESSDPYLVEAAVEALGQIGDPACRATLERAAHEGALRVRRAAGIALRRLEDGASEKSQTGRE
jgi:HEAT repeat protein